MNKIIDEVVKIDELSLQIKDECQRSLYVNLCYTKASINKMMLDNNISFENMTYEYLLQKLHNMNNL